MDFPENEIRLWSYKNSFVTSEGFKDELEVWSSRDNPDSRQHSLNHEEALTKLILLSIVSNHKYTVLSSRYWCASFYYHTFTKLIAINFGWMQELKKQVYSYTWYSKVYVPRYTRDKYTLSDINRHYITNLK